MQLVQPPKIFSVTINNSIGMRYMRTCELGLTLKNFDVCTVTMGVACPLFQRTLGSTRIPHSALFSRRLNFVFFFVDFFLPAKIAPSKLT